MPCHCLSDHEDDFYDDNVLNQPCERAFRGALELL